MEEEKEGWRFPAEWGRHESVWLAWPPLDYVVGRPAHQVAVDMIISLHGHTKVTLLIQNEKEKEIVFSKIRERLREREERERERDCVVILEKNDYYWVEEGEKIEQKNEKEEKEETEREKEVIKNIIFFEMEHSDIWMRDFGPIFAFSPFTKKKEILQFEWKEWGYFGHFPPDPSNRDGLLPSRIGNQKNMDVKKIKFASEGGNREFSDDSVLLSSLVVEKHRNSSSSIQQIEKNLKELFSLKKIIWIQNGLADDRHTFLGPIPGTDIYTCLGTGGHIDETARFVDNETILLAAVHPEDQNDGMMGEISHKNMEENYKILSEEKHFLTEKPYKIIRVISPPPLVWSISNDSVIFDSIQTLCPEIKEKKRIKIVLAASYLNFLVSNGVVLIPKYFRPGRHPRFLETDENAKRIFEEVFPKHKIIQIETENVNCCGGGMHCISQQEPE